MKYKTLIFMALIVSLFLLSACAKDMPAETGDAAVTEEQVEEQVSDSIEEELVPEDEEYVEIGEMI